MVSLVIITSINRSLTVTARALGGPVLGGRTRRHSVTGGDGEEATGGRLGAVSERMCLSH